MTYLRDLFSEQFTEAIGWTIFHSIWQAFLILIILVVILFFMKDFSARIRYFVAYLALIVLLIWSTSTTVTTFKYAQEKQDIKTQLLTSENGINYEIKALLDVDNYQNLKKQSKARLKWMKFKVTLQNNFHIVFALWLLGLLFFLIKMAGAMVFLLNLPKKPSIPFDSFWQQKLTSLSNKLQLSKKVTAIQSYLVKVPLVIGQLKPIIVFPVSVFTGLTNKEIEAILAHELAHIKRNDYIFNFIQSLIETLFFFHPAVWIISRIIRDEREHSCDDMAVDITGDKLSYIKALAAAEELTLKNPYNAVAFAQKNGGLLTRVKRLKTINNMKNKVTEGFFAASLIFLSLILVSFTLVDNNSGDEFYNRYDIYEIESKWNTSGVKPDVMVKPNMEMEPVINIFPYQRDTIENKVREAMVEMEEVSEDLEKIVEVALNAEDEAMTIEILRGVEEALKEIDFSEVQVEAMEKAAKEIKALNLDSIINEAMAEAQEELTIELEQLKENELLEQSMISEAQAVEIAKQAIEASTIALENIEMDSIIQISLTETMKALEDLNIGEIITDALEEAEGNFNDSSFINSSKSMEKMEEELMELEEK